MPKETEFAVRCFKDEKRMWTNRLTRAEARNFSITAQHLVDFLSGKHGIPNLPWTKKKPRKLGYYLVYLAKGSVLCRGPLQIAHAADKEELAYLNTVPYLKDAQWFGPIGFPEDE